MDNVKSQASKLSSLLAQFNASAIAMLAIAVFVTFLVAYGLYWYITRSMLKKHMYFYPDTKIPVRGDELNVISSTQSPFTKNGKRKTIAFWLYVHDVSQTKNGRREILRVGAEDVLPTSVDASPYIFMDGSDTKLYIVFKPSANDLKKIITDKFTNSDDETDRFKKLAESSGVVLPYVPIQRWVHIAVVINETGSGGTFTAYVDAEPVVAVNRNVFNLKLDVEGSLYVGGKDGDGFAGLVSRVMIADYDLNAQDIYNLYKQGPIDNLFAKMGLPAYGVRSPVYRL